VPVPEPVTAVCELLGLGPVHVGNEGCLLAFLASEQSDVSLNGPHGLIRVRGHGKSSQPEREVLKRRGLSAAPATIRVERDRLGAAMSDLPQTDDRHPAEVVTVMVEQVLRLAETWTAWDGQPRPIDGRVYTPHKAIRRIADHLIDHLAEIEARQAGVPTIPDGWHASATTTPADLAPFTPDDLDEARSRLTRLAQLFAVRLRALTEQELGQHGPGAWSPRQIAFHLEESLYYANAVGNLHG
jgi:hypothetical protein